MFLFHCKRAFYFDSFDSQLSGLISGANERVNAAKAENDEGHFRS